MLFLLLISCTTESNNTTWHKDIRPIAEQNCVSCHSEGSIGPFDLRTMETWTALGDVILTTITEKRMPPWGAEKGHQEYRYDISLSENQIKSILQWYESNTPEGNEEDHASLPTVDQGGMEHIDIELSMPASYTPITGETDDYRCFPIEWDRDTYITGFNAIPGNIQSVHHLVAYWIPPRQTELVRGFDEQDEKAGYPCYGGPAMTGWEPDSIVDSIVPSFLGQWAPGMLGTTLPEGIGLKVEQGGTIVLQMHYFTALAEDPTDLSKFQFAVSDEVDKEAYYVPWMNTMWYYAPESMLIPANEEEVTHNFTSTFEENGTLSLIFGTDFNEDLQLHSIFPHMHQLGKSIMLTLGEGDTQQTLIEVPNYDFNWQREYHLTQPIDFSAQESIDITCTWDNTIEYRSERGVDPIEPIDVGWGENTQDEMCIAMLLITKK